MVGMSNSWDSRAHVARWPSCRGPHDVFDLEITISTGNGLSNVARSEVDHRKNVITSPASPYHRPSSGIINQKSSPMARSGVDLQIKKSLCTFQVSPVLMRSNVSSKMKRCKTAESH